MAIPRAAPTAPERVTEESAATSQDVAALHVLAREVGAAPESSAPDAQRTLRLTDAQAELLYKICLRHRRSLPIYLQVAQHEIGEIDALIAQLL
jgi:hypothetical protein